MGFVDSQSSSTVSGTNEAVEKQKISGLLGDCHLVIKFPTKNLTYLLTSAVQDPSSFAPQSQKKEPCLE